MASERDIHTNHINQPINAPSSPSHTEGNGVDSGAKPVQVFTRAYMAFAALVILAIAIIIKVFVLQLFPSEDGQNIASNFTYKVNEIEPVRGRIISSDGSVLASSVPEYEIRWDSQAEYDKAEYKQKIDSLTF